MQGTPSHVSDPIKRARTEQEELAEKGRDQRWLSERYGKWEHGISNHPLTKRTGQKGASNVGEDETSGSE